MTPTVALLVLAVLAVIGAIRSILGIFEAKREIGFAKEYAEKFQRYARLYVNSHIRNSHPSAKERRAEAELYNWLALHANKMQRDLGDSGVGTQAHPAVGLVNTNCPILTHTLSNMGAGSYVFPTNDITTCQNMLLAHLGDMEEYCSRMVKRSINPVLWLTEGVRALVTLPFWLAYESGLIGYGAYAKAGGSFIVRLIAFIVPIASLAVGIVANWETLSANITQWLGG